MRVSRQVVSPRRHYTFIIHMECPTLQKCDTSYAGFPFILFDELPIVEVVSIGEIKGSLFPTRRCCFRGMEDLFILHETHRCYLYAIFTDALKQTSKKPKN
jgi:hypothetical protein